MLNEIKEFLLPCFDVTRELSGFGSELINKKFDSLQLVAVTVICFSSRGSIKMQDLGGETIQSGDDSFSFFPGSSFGASLMAKSSGNFATKPSQDSSSEDSDESDAPV